MNTVNLMACWMYGCDNTAFDNLLDGLKVQECTCIISDPENISRKDLFLIKIGNPLSYYQNADICVELDDEIINRMKPYEQVCMDIIYRWHKSFIEKNDYKTIKMLYFVFLRFWNDYIVRHNINLMLISIMPHAVEEFIPYAICKARDIPTVIQGVIPFTNGEKTNYILRPSHDMFDANISYRYKTLRNKYKDNNEVIPLNPEMRRYFQQYDAHAQQNKKVIFFNEKTTVKDRIKEYKERTKKYLKRGEYKVLANKIRYMVLIKTQTKHFLSKVEKLEEEAKCDRKFLLFCLHLQPEATTTPGGGNYADQLLAIRLLSQCLPDDMYLYVKEHPAYWTQKNRLESVYESRNEQFYKNIKNLRNVCLIDHKLSSGELLNKCYAVVTVTGTVGFEAIFKGIPVITFGATFYEDYPTVHRIRTKEDCKRAILAIQAENRTPNYREIEIFLAAIQKYVVPLGMFEKNFLDNGAPALTDDDRLHLVSKIIEFYQEFYYSNKEV